ncbi:MAG: ABC transporter permease subunit [Treponema sp.]|jgi:putative aldouronate transport system permease protein|nr:ABC transporter permease subunit [Treponema sp.]
MTSNNLTRRGLSAGQKILRCWQLYLLLLLPMAVIIIFSYGPMYGLQIAFKNYRPRDGFWGSAWVGLQHFRTFFSNFQIKRLIFNTLGISVYSLIAGFPIPIILAILINECTNRAFKKTVQMVTFAPYFISTVVMVSMILMFLGVYSGPINNLLASMGRERMDFMAKPELFKSIYVWTGVWQGAGYSSVIYIAALSSIDPTLYEAAIIDGANKFQRIIHIDIPGIMPTIIILLILSFGGIMSVGFEKIYLMQNQLNMSTSDVISTYVYRMGLENAQYSFSTAIGLFNSVINTVLLVIVNQIARRVGETSLW